ncbi:MAG: MCE family protein, partial [Halioglobus sp.]
SANAEIPELSDLVARNLLVLDDAIVAFEETMGNVDGLVSADSATIYRLNQALMEMSRAGRSLQNLARTLEEQPEALIRGKSGGN